LQLVGHTGGFGTLAFSDVGAHQWITDEGGIIQLLGEAGLILTSADFL